MLLRNKIAIVTGATRGIGRAVLSRFQAEGASVIGVFQKNEELAKQLEIEYASKNSRDQSIEFVQGSVADPVFVADLMQYVYNKYQRIDILVNNAGIAEDQLSMMMSLEQWNTVFDTNFLGTYHGCREVIPFMQAQQNGKVVNVISVSGVHGKEGQINYAGSKGAVVGLTRLLSRKHAQEGIHFNCIAPGMIETDMLEHIKQSKRDQFLQHTNVKRAGQVEEIASSILFLSSEWSNYVSNIVMKVDGGFMR